MPRRLRWAVPAMLAGAAFALGACGGSSSKTSDAALRLQREDLAAVAHALLQIEKPVAAEVRATKAVWPSIANGLPRDTRTLPAARLQAATLAAQAVHLPTLLGEQKARSLTGPGSGIAGLVRVFVALSERGWKLIGGSVDAIEAGSPQAASFARANVALYIESIYDAHFELAQVGKHVTDAYEKLGGAAAFGSSLTQGQVEQLAASYSEAADRLHPHTGVKLGA